MSGVDIRDVGGGLLREDDEAVLRRQAEARLALLSAVSERIGAIEDPAELLYAVSCAVGEHLQARRTLFTEIDLGSDTGIVRRDYCRGVPSVAGVYKISDYSERARQEMIAGHTVVNCDSKLDPRTAASYESTYEKQGERAYLAVPLLRDGRWIAELWISDDRPREWPAQDVALVQSVAERVWTAVEKLRAHVALRESEARMQFVGERADVGYWDWNIDTGSLIWSPVCKRLFGVPEHEEMSYARFEEALHPDDRERTREVIEAVLESPGTPDYDIEYRAVWPDGTVHWLQAKGSATFDENGRGVRMAGIALDITERKALELEREALLATERRLRAEADAASVAKDHFLALLSHELRTPMTTIFGWASFLGTGVSEMELLHKGIESIEQASRTQSRLIDDLLDVSRIVSGKMTLEKKLFDASETVRAAIDLVQPAARAGGVAVHADLGRGPAFVFADPVRIQQVIGNLLSNAVKFTPTGGEVHVVVRAAGDDVEIAVRDTGIGIAPDFLPHVFERFVQAEDGPTRRFGGLGLGLSIVRHLTELHGGSVRALSDGAGKGAELRVTLPAALPSTDTATPPRETARPVDANALAGISVLVVDDDPAARQVIATILSAFGARVTDAGSAREALQSVTAAKPDVLVSDIGMPEEDGYDLIRRIRISDTKLPAVAVTAYADSRDRDRVLGAGYHAHVSKPVEPGVLAGTVLRVLNR